MGTGEEFLSDPEKDYIVDEVFVLADRLEWEWWEQQKINQDSTSLILSKSARRRKLRDGKRAAKLYIYEHGRGKTPRFIQYKSGAIRSSRKSEPKSGGSLYAREANLPWSDSRGG